MGTRILVISDTPLSVAMSPNMSLLFWPQQGRFGADARNAIDQIISRKNEWKLVGCVVCEFVTSAPAVYALREAGYYGPVIWVPLYVPFFFDKFVHYLLMTRVLGPSDATIALSPSDFALQRDLFGLESVSIPAPGIDYSIFCSGGTKEPRSSLGLPDAPLLIYSGRLARDKNITGLLKAFECVRHSEPEAWLLLCISDSDAAYLSTFKSSWRNVEMRVQSSPMTLARLYRSADLFVSCATSVYETLGRAPLEAIACGTPVVLPAWNGFRDYFRAGNGSLSSVVSTADPGDDRATYVATDIEQFAALCVHHLRRPVPAAQTVDEVSVLEVRTSMGGLMERMMANFAGSSEQSTARFTEINIEVDAVEALDSLTTPELLQIAIRPDLHSLRWDVDTCRLLHHIFFVENERFCSPRQNC